MAFAFGLSAEIERNLISQRTKEAMARKKAEGVRLGRPSVVWGRESEIRSLLEKHSALRTAKLLGLPYHSVVRWVRLYVKKQPPDKGGR